VDQLVHLAQTAPDAGFFATLLGAATVAFLPRLAAAVAVAVVGYLAAGWVASSATALLARTGRLEATLLPPLGAAVRYAILIFVLVAALAQLGVQTTSILAVLGAAGLAVGLALQGTLQNIAAGIMLLWLRPFRVGDYIEVPAVTGTVEEVALFATRMKTWDGIYKFVPNSELWNKTLTNYTRNPTRLVLIEFPVADDSDLAAGRAALRDMATATEGVLGTPAVEVVPLAVADGSVTLQLRAWATTADFWSVRWSLAERGRAALAAAEVAGPVHQRLIRFAEPPPQG
jgi:small conductance mechanosensitive channel